MIRRTNCWMIVLFNTDIAAGVTRVNLIRLMAAPVFIMPFAVNMAGGLNLDGDWSR